MPQGHKNQKKIPSDPLVKAEMEHAVKAAELADIVPPGQVRKRRKPRTGREGYKGKIVEDRRETDPRGSLSFETLAKVETLRLVNGRYMSMSRAQAVKRVVRRIRLLMGVDSPPNAVLKWWVSEMVANLEEDSGVVRLGALRVLAEAIGLLRPGVGLMTRAQAPSWIPKVTFKTIPPKQKLAHASGVQKLANLELAEKGPPAVPVETVPAVIVPPPPSAPPKPLAMNNVVKFSQSNNPDDWSTSGNAGAVTVQP